MNSLFILLFVCCIFIQKWQLKVYWKLFIILIGPAPWYNKKIAKQKTKKRKIERPWHKPQLPANRKLFVDQCLLVNNLVHSAKMKYYSSLIE